MDLEKIKAFNEAEALKKKQAEDEKKAEQNARTVAGAVGAGSLLGSKASTEVKKAVKESGEGIIKALQESQAPVADALNSLVLATVISKDPAIIETAKSFAALLTEISKASVEFKGSKLNLLPIANEKLATSIDKLADNVAQEPGRDYSKDLKKIQEQIGKLNLNVQPIVNVPNFPETVLDIQPVADAVIELKTFLGKQKAPSVSIDMDSVVKGLDSVKKTIASLSFPVPNYVLPFKDVSGAAVQVQLDASGNVPTSGGAGGTQYTEDAAATANPVGTAVNLIRADTPAATVTTDGDNVAQRGTNYGAAYTQVVTSAGAFVDTFGGGTQYADGAARGTATGTIAMVDDGTNVQSQAGDTSGNTFVAGNIASGAADSGNPVKVGGKYNTTMPTLTDGQRGDAQLTSRGAVKTTLFASDTSTAVTVTGDNSDAIASSATANKLSMLARGYVYNSVDSTWNRMPGDTTGVKVVEAGSSTSTLTNVSSSASSVTLLSALATRRKFIIYNDSTSDCYVKYGTTASATSFTWYLPSYATIEEDKYTGRIDAIWVSANGSARVTELT